MKSKDAIGRLAALAHEGRLAIFRMLVKAGPEGMSAGDLARALGAPASTMSAAFNVLSQAGLITSQRAGRSIIYAADYEGMGDLLSFLMEDCCGGNPQICAPLAAIAQRCAPQEAACPC